MGRWAKTVVDFKAQPTVNIFLEVKWVNNRWWRWQNRTDLGNCTHQCDETQGNNSSGARRQTTKAEDKQQKKKEAKSVYLLTHEEQFFLSKALVYYHGLFPGVSSHCWVHFPRSVLFHPGMCDHMQLTAVKLQELTTVNNLFNYSAEIINRNFWLGLYYSWFNGRLITLVSRNTILAFIGRLFHKKKGREEERKDRIVTIQYVWREL